MRDIEEKREGRHRRNRPPVEAIITGGVFAGVFGTLWAINGPDFWWCIFPMVFAGLLPIIDGLRRLITGKKEGKLSARDLELEQEKQILKAAHEQKGRVTAAGAALRTNLSIQEAAQVLDRMAKEGHAVVNVTQTGTVEYEFQDFLPPDAEHRHLT